MTLRADRRVRCTSPPHGLATAALAAAALLVCGAAQARTGAPYYAYGGLSAGSARGNFDEPRIAGQVLDAGSGVSSIGRSGRRTAWRVFGGYQFNPYYALELGYHDLGRFGFDAATTPAGALKGEMKFVGASADLLGMMPVGDSLSLFARVGANWTRTRSRFEGTGTAVVADPQPSRRATNAKYGLGLQFAFTPQFLMRAEAERYRVNSATGTRGDVNVLSVSLVVPFGRGSGGGRMMQMSAATEAPRPAATIAPIAPIAPVAVAAPVVAPEPIATPAQAVMPAPRPIPAARRSVSHSAESIFGFDQSTLQPAGRQALDGFAVELRGLEFESVSVEGHTDRLGSTAYNQALSQRRAEVVRNYLVDSGGVPAAKVQARGMGESAPMPTTADCKGERPSTALIACLQPDRRVDIDVTGTR